MKNILLICTAGMSTSFLVEKMKKSASDEGLEVEIKAIRDAEAKNYVGVADVVLLGPQVKYLESQMKELFGEIPVSVINMVDYGMMDGKKVLNSALDLLK